MNHLHPPGPGPGICSESHAYPALAPRVAFFAVGLLAFAAALTGCRTPGDYGDAPDQSSTGYPALFATNGLFPTLAARNGATTRRTDLATLGPTASAERDANDPLDPDGQPNLNPSNTDLDDGIVDFVLVLISIPPPAAMVVNVSAPAGIPADTWFINAVIDMNLDGAWGGAAASGVPEWCVRNFPFQIVPGDTTPVRLPPFFFGDGNRLPDGAWMRLLLTREPVREPDWDGSGRFAAGEVEDHVISLPRIKSCIPIGMPDQPRYVFRGQALIPVRLTVRNLGATACDVNLTLTRLSGLVTLAAPAGCAGPGGGPINCVIPALAPGPGGVVLLFNATRPGVPGDLPSRWNYRVAAQDPPAVVTAEGVTLGYGDSTGDFDFVGDLEVTERVPIQQKLPVTGGDRW
jgi:hypothetical protein